MIEKWKPIPGFEELYLISNLGRIKSIGKMWYKHGFYINKKEIILKQEYDKRSGYYRIMFGRGTQKENIRVRFLVHVLVARLFVSNPNNFPEVNHIDGVKTNNIYTNLEWTTHSGNMQHAINILRRKLGKRLLNKEIIEIRNKFNINKTKFDDLAKEYNVGYNVIYNICNNKSYKYVI